VLNDIDVDCTTVQNIAFGVDVIATGSFPPLVTITNSRIESNEVGLTAGSGGVSTIVVRGSSVKGSVSAFLDSLSTADVKIAHTQLVGPAVNVPPNTLTCFGAYDGALQALDAACQPQAPIANGRSGELPASR